MISKSNRDINIQNKALKILDLKMAISVTKVNSMIYKQCLFDKIINGSILTGVKEKSLKKICKTWKIIKLRSIKNYHFKEKKLA